MASYSQKLSEKKYNNWIKAQLAVLFTKDGLEPFVCHEIKEFQLKCLDRICYNNGLISGTLCSNCRTENVIKCPTNRMCNVRHGKCSYHRNFATRYNPADCPNKICHNFTTEIQNAHRYYGPSYKNTDATQWCSNSWEIAKCFMPPDGYKDVACAEETDFNGIISVILNHKDFQGKIHENLNSKTNIFEEAREIGRKVQHSSTLEVEDSDLQKFFELLQKLLSDPGYLATDTHAQNAKQKLTDLEYDTLVIGKDDIKKVLDDVAKAIHDKMKAGLYQQYDILKLDMIRRKQDDLQSLQSQISDGKTQLQNEADASVKRLNEEWEKEVEEGDKERADLAGREEMLLKAMKTETNETWDRCIERESESDANILLEREILPSKSELNTACQVFGRDSKVVSLICSTISQHVRKQSNNVIDVWPSYKENNETIIFIVILKNKSTFSVFKDYEYLVRCENDVSTEGDFVAEYETKDRTMNQFDNEIYEKLRKSINDNADDLFKRHSNINVILPSLIKSVGYKTGQHDIKQEPCIALYVAVKGFIPLNETPFQKNINDFPTDVLEGVFEPFMKGPNDYHEHLKIGLAIHANVLNGDGILGGTLGGFIDHSMHGLCGLTCAHVVYNAAELMEIKDKKQFSSRKPVYQPIGERSSAFGEVVHAVYDNGSPCSSGVEVALIGIHNRHPNCGSFPETLNDFEAGFDAINPLCFHSGAVCETSEIRRRTEVYKFGMSSEITRGSFALQGAVVRKSQMQGQCHGFGYILMNQMVVLKIGDKPFAEPGDSGALALIEGGQDSIAIGIVEGGMNGRVFVTPICDILRAVGCTELKMHRFTRTDSVEEMEIG